MKMMCGKCGSPIGEGNLVAFCAKCYTELQKENAELRECLKKMILVAENRMPKHPTFLEVEYINDAKAVLEGGNHAND